MKRLVCCYWTVPPLTQQSSACMYVAKWPSFLGNCFILYCFQFHPQGLAGYPGAKGDEGPKGEDVSPVMDYLKRCKIITY